MARGGQSRENPETFDERAIRVDMGAIGRRIKPRIKKALAPQSFLELSVIVFGLFLRVEEEESVGIGGGQIHPVLNKNPLGFLWAVEANGFFRLPSKFTIPASSMA